mmetsp:Transcript_5820/g.15461  ORF Transcript_5820/g.15461 Transcript_5820/m.15461 type:complete len:330 (-) Transcript_5820:53-1042(-)
MRSISSNSLNMSSSCCSMADLSSLAPFEEESAALPFSGVATVALPLDDAVGDSNDEALLCGIGPALGDFVMPGWAAVVELLEGTRQDEGSFSAAHSIALASAICAMDFFDATLTAAPPLAREGELGDCWVPAVLRQNFFMSWIHWSSAPSSEMGLVSSTGACCARTRSSHSARSGNGCWVGSAAFTFSRSTSQRSASSRFASSSAAPSGLTPVATASSMEPPSAGGSIVPSSPDLAVGVCWRCSSCRRSSWTDSSWCAAAAWMASASQLISSSSEGLLSSASGSGSSTTSAALTSAGSAISEPTAALLSVTLLHSGRRVKISSTSPGGG